MATFRIRGMGEDGKGNTITDGTVFESPLPLDKMFKNKYERLSKADVRRSEKKKVTATAPEPVVEEEEVLDEEPQGDDASDDMNPEPAEDFGDDVSDQFPRSAAASMKVFKKGNKFTVTDGEGKVLNPKTIHLKKDVTKFISRHQAKKN